MDEFDKNIKTKKSEGFNQMTDKEKELQDKVFCRYNDSENIRNMTVLDKWEQLDSYDKHRQWVDGVLVRYNENGQEINYQYDGNTNDTSFIAENKRFSAAQIDAKSIKPILTPKNSRSKESTIKVQKMLNLAIDKADLAYVINRANEQRALVGTGYWLINLDTLASTDYGVSEVQGKIQAEFIDVAEAFPDARAKNSDEMEYFIIKRNLPIEKLKQFKALYMLEEESQEEGTEIVEMLDSEFADIDNAEIEPIPPKKKYIYKNIDLIEKCSYPIEEPMSIYRDYYSPYFGNNYGFTHTRYFEKKFNKDTLSYYIYYAELANDVVIREEKLPITRMPIVALLEEDRRSSFFGISRSEKMLTANKNYNIAESILTKQAKLQGSVKYAIDENSGIEDDEIDEFISSESDTALKIPLANGKRISDVIQKFEMPQLSSDQIAYKNEMRQSLENTSGISKFATGQSSGSITTSTGVNSMIEQATSTQRHWLNNEFMKAFKKSVELILEFMQIHLETLENNSLEMAIASQYGIYSEVTISSEDIKKARFDILINPMQGFIPDIERSKAEVMQLMTNVMQYGVKNNEFPFKWSTLMAKYMNIPDTDNVVQDALDYESDMEEQKMMFFTQLYNMYTQALLSQPDIQLIYETDQNAQQQVNELVKNAVVMVTKQLIPTEPTLSQELASKVLPQLILQVRQTLGLNVDNMPLNDSESVQL